LCIIEEALGTIGGLADGAIHGLLKFAKRQAPDPNVNLDGK